MEHAERKVIPSTLRPDLVNASVGSSFDMLIKGMTFKDVTNQISFHTHESLKLLKKAGTIK